MPASVATESEFTALVVAHNRQSDDLAAHATRIAALESGTPPPTGVAAPSDWIEVDGFTTGTDDEKHQKAHAAAKAKGWGVAFGNRIYDLRTPVTAYDGMCMVSLADPGPKLQMRAPLPAQLDLNMTGALIRSTGTVYGVYLRDLAVFGNTTAYLWSQPSGSIYGAQFDGIALYGTAGGFGTDSELCLVTQAYFTGHWQVHGWRQTPFHLRGADCSLWQSGYLNVDSPTDVPGNGRPQVWLDGMEKSWGGGIYSTGRNGWVALRVSGGDDRQLVSLTGGVYEGYKASSPTTVPAVQMQGGVLHLNGTNIGHVAGPAKGMIHQTGGHLILGAVGAKFADSALTLPLLAQDGGTADITVTPVGFGGGARRPVPILRGTSTTTLAIANRLP